MKPIFRSLYTKFKSRIQRRLDKKHRTSGARPTFTARNIDYDVSFRDRGIGAIHLLVQELGLAKAIDRHLHVLKIHMPYHESDHVLNIAYNALCNGTCLEDIELRRNDEAFLDALGAQRIPDPTTAGDFCRRFNRSDITDLFDAIDEIRLEVWAKQPRSFFDRATIDMDGTLTETTGACKEGMDIAYNGVWGYHPLVVSLAETGEVLSLVNRSGNRPSHEGAAEQVDRYVWLCVKAGFDLIVLRGDTDFSQTEHLDRWDGVPNVRFVFGYNAMSNLREIAEDLPASAWQPLMLPESNRWQERHHDEKRRVLRMEFKTFVNAFVLIPCQVIRKARQVVLRILGWNPNLSILFRLLSRWRQ